MPNLAEKIILITGAGRGMGRELALSLAQQGAIIAANDISPINVEEVAHQITSEGGQARVYLHDVAKKVAAQALTNQVIDDFGRIDILINSANVELAADLLSMDEWDLHRVFEVNTIGVFLLMQSVGRVMREQGGGLILNLLGDLERDLPPAYAASRAAVAELTHRAAPELARQNVRIYGLAKHASLDGVSDLAEIVHSLLDAKKLEPGAILRPKK